MELAQRLRAWPNTKDQYYKIRQRDFRSEIGRAAQFIFLNKTCWNGLYRVNRHGKFNVPYGHYVGRSIYHEDDLLRASIALQRASLQAIDFEAAVTDAGPGDFVYLDPPYTVLHGNNGFLRYNERLFSWADQVRLSQVARQLANRGSCVIVSNADHKATRSLYPSFICSSVARKSRIAANPQYRIDIQEIVLTSFPVTFEQE
jgi:DNA adenine methylase